jgi:glyceraldehyde 3-phosphate dehydrogenase
METPELRLVAVNDVASSDQIVYLLRHDSVYGRYDKTVTLADGKLLIGERTVALSSQPDPGRLPWNALHVDLVFECTGAFTRRQDLIKHV